VISRVGVPQYEEAPVGFGSLFGRNITLTGGPAPARACIERLLPAVLDGTVNPGKVFDWTVQPGGHAEGLRGNGRAHTGTLDPGCTARDGWPGREGRMLNGTSISLRPVREADLDVMYAAHTDIANRGRFFPLGVVSESAFRRDFADQGFWQMDEGTLLIVSPDGDTAGHIEFFKPVSYWDAFELSYLLYDERFSGRGWVTEAVQLLVDYLFATKKQQRIQLVIVPENAASIRIAEKCGFVLEGTARGAFFNDGRSQDVLIYSLLRADARPWRAEEPL
jgi:RimJ/RimL family protein N-acetyltransferase